MSTDEMPKPSWVDDALHDYAQVFKENEGRGGVKMPIPEFTPVTDFSTFFAEFILKEDDLLLHLFPRGGAEDTWTDTRRMEDPGHRFPEGIEDKIKSAADETWQGNIAVKETKAVKFTKKQPEYLNGNEPMEEVSLGSLAVQFQNAKTTAKAVGVDKFVDKFCEELDARLDLQ